MNAILEWFNPYRWMALGLLVAGLVAGYFAWEHHQRGIGRDEGRAEVRAEWNAQKAEDAKVLAAETARANKAEGELNAARAALEDKDATNRATVAGLERRLANAAAANGGRLRDPNGRSCPAAESAGPASAVSGAASGPETGGLLSVQLSDLLRARLRDADEINRAYTACRADSFNVRSMLPK